MGWQIEYLSNWNRKANELIPSCTQQVTHGAEYKNYNLWFGFQLSNKYGHFALTWSGTVSEWACERASDLWVGVWVSEQASDPWMSLCVNITAYTQVQLPYH